MALQLSFDDAFGSTHASAYHRIVGLELSVEDEVAHVTIATYVDQTARTNDMRPVGKKRYRFEGTDYTNLFDDTNMSPVDKNPIKNAYDHIKTLPEWSAATDV